MARSEAKSAEEYLAELPPERRAVLARVRAVILEHLPDGFVEAMNWGMISYEPGSCDGGHLGRCSAGRVPSGWRRGAGAGGIKLWGSRQCCNEET